MGHPLTGFDRKVAVVTGAGRMRSIGRPIALALARPGCDPVLTGSGKPFEAYPEDERRAGWRDIDAQCPGAGPVCVFAAGWTRRGLLLYWPQQLRR